jgi:TetR/AcrR family transcriptional repressor of bet genes
MIGATDVPQSAGAPRKASKDVRRQQLIRATLAVIARKGYASLTVADVARAAGLSVGIINFHFDSKDKLLAETLRFLADEYNRNWKAALAAAPPEPAARLKAVLLADFHEAIFTPDKIAAWIAFWGETQGRPAYDEICGPAEVERGRVLLDICRDLVDEGQYAHEPRHAMRALEAMLEGLWLGVVSAASRIEPYLSRQEAMAVMLTSLAAFFPRHFGPEG